MADGTHSNTIKHNHSTIFARRSHVHAHLIQKSLDLPHLSSQTKARLVHPFLHSPHIYATPFPHFQNLPLFIGGAGPPFMILFLGATQPIIPTGRLIVSANSAQYLVVSNGHTDNKLTMKLYPYLQIACYILYSDAVKKLISTKI